MAAAEGLPPDLVFVDLETTGGSAAYDRITEVGLVRVRDGELIEEWSSLVNPERPIPAYIEAFTGISNEMVAGAPRFAEIAPSVRQKLQGAVFVAHNARFDYSFLRAEFFKSAVDFSTQVLCTVKLSRRLFPEYARHNLDAVMERHELTCGARHRALGDARVLHDFWSKLRREVDQERLAAAVRTVLGAHKLPAHLPPGLADDLPEGPGVYRFFGDNGILLYVGKGNLLRSRVCSHFAGQDALSVDGRLAIEVRRIDWVQTAGELGSMLREAQWLRAGKPVYNRRTKDTAECHTLRVAAAQTQGGPGSPVEALPVEARPVEALPVEALPVEALPVEALPVEGVDAADLAQCFGVFHSAKDARKALGDIARAKQLCLKVLGIEDSPGSCLAYQVGKCKGACVGKEPLILHNMRLQLALSSLKLKAWPFPGRIALRERSPRTGMPEWMRDTELHVLDQWAYLGTARTDEELAALGSSCSSGAFDVDVYRILVRYFAKNPKLDWVDMRGSTMCT